MAGVKLDPKAFSATQKACSALIRDYGDAQVFAALRRYMDTARRARRLESEIGSREKELAALKAKAGRTPNGRGAK